MVKYYGVAYLKDTTIHLTKPHDTQEECLSVLKELMNTQWASRVVRTTVIKRDMQNEWLFGCPKSLNVCETK